MKMIMEENKELISKNDGLLPIGNEEEYKWTKENNKWGHKVFAVIGAIVVAIVGIIGLIFGKVVEATLFEEVAKWVVMAIGIALIVCVLCYVPVEMAKLARHEYYPKYGKKWFKKAYKLHILGKKDE